MLIIIVLFDLNKKRRKFCISLFIISTTEAAEIHIKIITIKLIL